MFLINAFVTPKLSNRLPTARFCPLNPSDHKVHPVADSIRVPLPAPLDACNIPQHLAAQSHAYVLILSLNVCNCK